MRVKRIFVEGSVEAGEPVVSHLVIQTGEVGKAQHFSPNLIEKGAAEGWLSLGGGKVVITTADHLDDAEFEILNPPGAYCCHCGEKLEGGNEIGAAHVAAEHEGEESPDPSNPSGYRVDNFYRCVRVS